MKTKITNPNESEVHRVIREFEQARDAAIRAHLIIAGEILRHHQREAVSDQSVYEVTGVKPGDWSYTGSHYDDDVRWLAVSIPYEYATVISGDTPWKIATRFAAPAVPDRYERAICLRSAADKAVPLIAAVLAFGLRADQVEWTTSGTLTAAARHVAYVAADQFLARSYPRRPGPRDLFDGVLNLFEHSPTPAVSYAEQYLAERDSLNETLAERKVKWGGNLLTGKEAAEQAGRAWPTWRADVARGAAPSPDEHNPSRWRDITVDLWVITQNPSVFEAAAP